MFYLTDDQIKELRKRVPSYKKLFPPQTGGFFDDKMVGLVGEANREIGNLNSYARLIPNSDLLIYPLLLKEALASSKIEGTQASVKDILKREANLHTIAREVDVQEVINYRDATKLGLELLKTLPITGRLIKSVHNKLMEGIVRGAEKRRGEYRVGQNAIGREGDITSVKYLPPPANEVSDLMKNLEIYINSSTVQYDKLVRCAFMHYEFEAIHPFADGNGRVGRLLITLYFLKESVLKYPLIYPSAFFLHYKDEYEKRLMQITKEDDWKGWLEFFLNAIIEQAKKSGKLIEAIDNQYQEAREIATENMQSVHTEKLVEIIFEKPYVIAPDVAKKLNVKHQTAISLLRKLSELGLLTFDSNKKKNIPFVNIRLVDLLERA